MYKTSNECSLELISYTAMATGKVSIRMLDADSNQDIDYVVAKEQDCDFMPVSAARVSFGKESNTGQDVPRDIKLMKFLADEGHTSCFEHQSATFLIECPLFIAAQIQRHRTFSYNQISRRYTEENLEFWVPDNFRGQATKNKQCSSDEMITALPHNPRYDNGHPALDVNPFVVYSAACNTALNAYNELIEGGVAREQARAVLPQSLLTKFYQTGSLRNWSHFLNLRRDTHSQLEVQIIANRIADKLRDLWPNSCNSLGI